MSQGMDGTKAVPQRLATRLAEVAAELRREIYGEAGFPKWGTKFVEIEATVLAVGRELSRQMAEQTLAEQAQHTPPESFQSDAGETGLPTGTQPRQVETPAGTVTWPEPQACLPKARKAFSPAGPRVGAEAGRVAVADADREGRVPGSDAALVPAGRAGGQDAAGVAAGEQADRAHHGANRRGTRRRT